MSEKDQVKLELVSVIEGFFHHLFRADVITESAGEGGSEFIEGHGEEGQIILTCEGLPMEREFLVKEAYNLEPMVRLVAGVGGGIDDFGTEGTKDVE